MKLKNLTFFSKNLIWLPAFAVCLISGSPLLGQTTTPASQDSIGKLRIESSETGEAFLNGGREIRILSGAVRLRQDETLVFCDTAVIDGNDATLRGNVLIQQGDSIRIFGDSALYFGDRRQADVFGEVALEKGEQQLFTDVLHYDLANKLATYHTGALLTNQKSQLRSQHGYYYVDRDEVFFKGDVLVADPEFTLRTDTMGFNTKTRTALFLDKTLITQKDSKIYCEGGFYDIENNFAEFDVNPQFIRDGQRGRARKIRYVGATNEYILDQEAYIEEENKIVEARVIRYNADTEVTLLSGDAHYRDSVQDVYGEIIRYFSREKRFILSGRSKVIDPPNIIEADSLDFNEELGNGLALGRVIWTDTAADLQVLSGRMDYNRQTQYINAYGGFDSSGETGRPVMKSVIERDTLFMSADTLTSYRLDTLTDDRTILAYRDVRIFKSDLQGRADSASFSTVDSIFYFYKIDTLPVLWSDTSQFSADTVLLSMKNKQIDRIWMHKDALVINSGDERYFNQIKGEHITAFFKENEIREMLTEGQAEAVYFALDDDNAYIGVNESTCARMRLFFGNNKVDNIRFYEQPKGKFTPMKQVGRKAYRLPGFFWETQRRPKRLADLL